MFTLRLVPDGYAHAGGGARVDILDDGAPWGRLSICLPDEPPLPPGLFWLKDWSENGDVALQFIHDGSIEIVRSIPMVILDHGIRVRAAKVIRRT